MNNLSRFHEASDWNYDFALKEIQQGRKRSHWIWFIFPQMRGLGFSSNSQYYGITGRTEAEAFLRDEILGSRLREITAALLEHRGKSTQDILGHIDAIKVRSSMTLFDLVSPNDIFAQVLDEFYDGRRCERSLRLIEEAE